MLLEYVTEILQALLKVPFIPACNTLSVPGIDEKNSPSGLAYSTPAER
jgi:hypothetical protein